MSAPLKRPAGAAIVGATAVESKRLASAADSAAAFAARDNPLDAAIAKHGRGGVLVLDGGLATHMEALGADIDHALWSARCLQDDPAMIQRAHKDYYAAGASVGITASYQASFEGFKQLGVDEEGCLAMTRRSVELARNAAGEGAHDADGVVAGSVGPYGASLHNGSEYTGLYPGMDEEKLLAWHRPRARALVEAGCDLLACETVPCLMEARAIVRLVEELQKPAWLCFSCNSGTTICSGEPFKDAVTLAASCKYIVGVGANCTPPEHISELVSICKASKGTHQRVVIYPNSGESWDGETHTWKDGTATKDERFAELAKEWAALGADCIGGCCRTSPATISVLRDAFSKKKTLGLSDAFSNKKTA